MKSVGKTYLIATSGSLIPSWIGSGLLTNEGVQENLFNSAYGIISLLFFALAFWGTSFGYMYLGKWKYAILSAIGKWLLIIGSIFIFYLLNDDNIHQHPYIIFIGLATAFMWGMVDYILLYSIAKKTNLVA